MILEWFGVFMFSCELLSLLIKNSIWDYVCELLVCYVQYHAILENLRLNSKLLKFNLPDNLFQF